MEPQSKTDDDVYIRRDRASAIMRVLWQLSGLRLLILSTNPPSTERGFAALLAGTHMGPVLFAQLT